MLRHRLSDFAGATALFACLALAMPVRADTPAHVRGTIQAVEDHELKVQTNRGGAEEIKLGDNTGLFIVTPATLSAIEPGKFVGITSVDKNGKPVAVEVHVFAESLRGLGEGHYPWDLESQPNMMTNANIAQVQQVGGDRVLKLNYKGGEQTIDLSPNVTVVALDKTTPDQLAPGRQVDRKST